jgi:glutamyl-tRNA reductase
VRDRAEDLARRFGGKAVGFQDMARELRRCDLVLTGTSCPHRILTRQDLAAAVLGRSLVVVDTSVPRDVKPSAGELRGVTLYDLDAIQDEMARNLSARADEARSAAPIIEEEVASFARTRSCRPSRRYAREATPPSSARWARTNRAGNRSAAMTANGWC